MKNIEIEIRDVDTKHVIASSNRLVNDRDVPHIVQLTSNILDSFTSGRLDLYKSQKRKTTVDDKVNKLW